MFAIIQTMSIEGAVLCQSVTHILLKCSFSPSLLGFDYIREVIEFCCETKRDPLRVLTFALKEVAKRDGSSVNKIDKRIRASIKDAKRRQGLLGMNEYYSERVYEGDEVRARETISYLVEMSRLEYEKRFNEMENLRKNA